MAKIRVQAPAKINLFLGVLGRRPDGYHTIETLFQEISLTDELIIMETPGQTTLEVPGHPDLENEGNLVLKALRLLGGRSGYDLHVKLTLVKRIPVAAGLGGGSSDAAATLKGVSELFGLKLEPAEFQDIALELGADVPFFLTGGTAVGEGVGERLTPIDLDMDYGVLLVNPGFAVSTARIFSEYSKILTGKEGAGKLWGILRECPHPRDLLHNDLQVVAERICPEITEVVQANVRAGFDRVLMTGSGPTVFALDSRDRVEQRKSGIPDKWTGIVAVPKRQGMVID
jgi:4-diphosphocytidyl-2-C-methyl-D-erythritol kinase